MIGIDRALTMLGLNEVNNNREIGDFISSMSKDGDIDVDPETTPWCAAIMNAWERSAGNAGTGKLNARSFVNYADNVETKEELQRGDIIVFDFEHNGVNGHVTYFDHWVDNAHNELVCLGGNQSNNVQHSTYPFLDVIAMRRSN